MRGLLSLMMPLALILFAGPASAGLIEFDEVPVGTFVSSEYVGDGVYFWQWGTSADTATWGNGNIVSPSLQVYEVSDDTLGLQFVQPGNSSVQGWVDGTTLSFDIWDTNNGSTNVYYYDENGILVGTVMGLGSSNPVTLNGPADNVGWIYFQDDGDGHVIDNISFGQVNFPSEQVPEPGTIALLGAGLLTVGMLRRRKQA